MSSLSKMLRWSPIAVVLACLVAVQTGCNEPILTSSELQTPAPYAQDVTAQHAAASTSHVYTFSDMSVVGSSRLRRHGNSMSMTLRTSEIPAGMAVTTWWVVFNEPDYCATTPCGEADIFDPAVRADVLYATGRVTGNGNRVNFAAQRRVGDTDGSIMPFFNALLGLDLPSVGLENLYTAEVHLVVRTHQEVIPSYMPDMIRTFNGGCLYPPGIPADFGAPGPNTCSDIQFAIHLP